MPASVRITDSVRAQDGRGRAAVDQDRFAQHLGVHGDAARMPVPRCDAARVLVFVALLLDEVVAIAQVCEERLQRQRRGLDAEHERAFLARLDRDRLVHGLEAVDYAADRAQRRHLHRDLRRRHVRLAVVLDRAHREHLDRDVLHDVDVHGARAQTQERLAVALEQPQHHGARVLARRQRLVEVADVAQKANVVVRAALHDRVVEQPRRLQPREALELVAARLERHGDALRRDREHAVVLRRALRAQPREEQRHVQQDFERILRQHAAEAHDGNNENGGKQWETYARSYR